MRKLSKIAALISLTLSTPVLAEVIEGVVMTIDGKPVAGAKVVLEGSGVKVITNAQGKFVIEGNSADVNEIHVAAQGFSHKHQSVAANSQNVSITLERSSIEVIDVTAAPIHLSSTEAAIPVSVLGGEQLRRKQSATLGDSLESLAGVHTNFHAKVASTPVIRGLSGPRVLIAQNGLDVSDVSRVGPDHAVSSEASTAQQIEVFRGPSTLFFGSGAIGGVVNVVDQRVPTSNDTKGEWLLEHQSVDDQKQAAFNLTTGFDNIAFYADGFYRKSNDYEVPVAADADHQESAHSGKHTVENSSEDSKGYTLGASYLLDNGYVGVAVEQFDREYGIPGHSHGGEHAHDEANVYADLEQQKIQLISQLNFEHDYISSLDFRFGHTDYEHAEIEQGVAGTIFKNETQEVRLDLLHQPLAGFNGGFSLHYKKSDVEAQGSEAFTPPSETDMIAASIIEERRFGEFLVQFGGRVEKVTLKADNLLLPHLDAHSHEEPADDHDDHGHDHDHDHGHGHAEENVTRVFAVDQEFTPVSLSAGVVWDFHKGYNLGLAVSRSQRAPAATELLSFGPHIGTRTYEVGALFMLEEHEGQQEFALTDKDIDMETSQNLDLTLRKTEGDVGFIFNLYYNQVDNYYYQIDTGLFAEDGHDHDHGHDHGGEGHDEHAGELPVFLFQTDDVVLNGFEAQVAWQVNDSFSVNTFADYVRARLKDGGDLPKTPPMRLGTELSYENEAWSAHLNVTRYQSQNRIASFETKTDGYTMVDLDVSYDLPLSDFDVALYFKGENLTDTEARVHTSFLKDIAPRPARNFAIGVKGFF